MGMRKLCNVFHEMMLHIIDAVYSQADREG